MAKHTNRAEEHFMWARRTIKSRGCC